MASGLEQAITAPAGDHAGEADRALLDALRRARLGSAVAFEHVVHATAPRLYRFLAVRLRDERDARDALQETYLAAWQGLPRLRRPEKLWPWLAGIAARKAADVARRRVPATDAEPHDAGAPDAAELMELREAIDALPAHLRDVLLLRFVLHLSEHETAAALGLRLGTVKSRAARARRRVAEALR